MDNRRRDLPSWMLGGKDKQTQQENPIETTHVPRRIKRKKLERTAVYGMNEAELVDTAFSFLKAENLQGFRAQEPTGQGSGRTAGSRMKRVKQDRADALSEEEAGDSKSEEDERTYVSESDPEVVAEEETVPYGDAANWGQAAGEGVQLRDTAKAHSASRDEEALQLVREIFFT